ncbi:MAG TPA: hypothetical protein VJ300_04260 [Thermoplasmata archaeon]|nr:hypothetical protein [Thermoplasmata archaeon]
MYGVVVCPSCRRAKGVDLAQRTTTCVCRFVIRITPSKAHARTEDARQLASLVGRVNAELRGGIEEYEKATSPRPRRRSTEAHARVVAASVGAGDRVHRIRVAAVELTRELEVFSLADWKRVLERLGIAEPERALETLIRERMVFEPKTGFYRAVSFTL